MPDVTDYILSCDQLRLSVEFPLARGEFGRIGSSAEMEISLPLVGLAEEDCTLFLDDHEELWLIREATEPPVRLSPPAFFLVGPFKFLIQERVELEVAAPPLATDSVFAPPDGVATRKPKRLRDLLILVGVMFASVAVAVWFRGRDADFESNDLPALTESAPKDPAVATKSNSESDQTRSEPNPPESSLVELQKAQPAASLPPDEAAEKQEQMNLEMLAMKVGPCVFRIEVWDGEEAAFSMGTGFAISADGLIATNFHVIEHGETFTLVTQQGAKFDGAKVIADDRSADLAILKIDAKNLPFLELAADSEVPVGKRVAVFGSPKGLGGTLSDGIISARPRDLQRTLSGEFIPNDGVLLQTTAPVSKGSSGSPLFDDQGRVIGVMTAILHGPDQPQNLNFAVPVEALAALVPKPGFRFPLSQRSRSAEAHADETPEQPAPADKALLADPVFHELRDTMVAEDWVKSMQASGSLVQRYPESAIAHFSHGYCASALRLDRQAELSFQRVLVIEPTNHLAWHQLGIAISNQSDPQRALVAFEKAVALKPDAAWSWWQIVAMNAVLQDWVKSAAVFETLEQVDLVQAKELARRLTGLQIPDARFRQVLAATIEKKFAYAGDQGTIQVRVVGVAANDTLSVRSGPGTSFSVVAAVPNETTLFVTGRSQMNGATEWIPVENGDWSGWVAGRFLAIVE